MTEIVGTWGRILRTNARVHVDPLFVGWTCYLLLLSMLLWIGMWQYQSIEFVYLGQVWMLVLPPLFLVLVSFALSPSVPDSGELDLRKFFFERRRRVFYPLAAFVVVSGLSKFLIVGRLSIDDLAVSTIWIACYLILTVTKRPLVHWAILVLLLLNMLVIAIHEINPA